MRSGQTRSAHSSAQALLFRIKFRYVFIRLPPISCVHVRRPDEERGKKTSDAHPFLMIQFSLIDTRPLHGMADVCEKHNIKLLTYGTFVRISLFSYRLPAYLLLLTQPLLLRLPFPFRAVWRFSCRCMA